MLTGLTLRERLATIAVAVKASGLPCHSVSIMYLDAEDAIAAHADGWHSPDYTQHRIASYNVVTEVFHAKVLDVRFTLFYDRPPTAEELAAHESAPRLEGI